MRSVEPSEQMAEYYSLWRSIPENPKNATCIAIAGLSEILLGDTLQPFNQQSVY
jgi:hypothetical protein